VVHTEGEAKSLTLVQVPNSDTVYIC
jgi:hypothetical protein